MFVQTKAFLNTNSVWYPRFRFPVGLRRNHVLASDDPFDGGEKVAVINTIEPIINPKGSESLVQLEVDNSVEKFASDIFSGELVSTQAEKVESLTSPLKFHKPFSLLLIQKGNYLIVDSLDANGLVNLGYTQNLAQSILDCLDSSELRITQVVFNWPMSGHQYAPRDEVSAQRVINNLLLDVDLETNIKKLFLFGDIAQKIILKDIDISKFKINDSLVKIVKGPRLSNMLHSPSLKSEFWSNYLEEK